MDIYLELTNDINAGLVVANDDVGFVHFDVLFVKNGNVMSHRV